MVLGIVIRLALMPIRVCGADVAMLVVVVQGRGLAQCVGGGNYIVMTVKHRAGDAIQGIGEFDQVILAVIGLADAIAQRIHLGDRPAVLIDR